MKGGVGRDVERAVKPQSPQRWGTESSAGKPHRGHPEPLPATPRAAPHRRCLSSPKRPPGVQPTTPPPPPRAWGPAEPHPLMSPCSITPPGSADSAPWTGACRRVSIATSTRKAPDPSCSARMWGWLPCVPPSSTLALGTVVPRMNSWGWHLCDGDRALCNGDKASCSGRKNTNARH